MYCVKTVQEAIEFATLAHGEQVRKYTGEPYIEHPIAVMTIVSEVPHTTEMLVAAILHDTVEDTNVTLREIEAKFGSEVARLVFWLTDVGRPEDGNRATRKAIDRAHLAEAPPEAQTIKVADMIHNSESVQQNDPNFWQVYREEKRMLLDVLTRADENLVSVARSIIEGYE